jgi:hypothetical protein
VTAAHEKNQVLVFRSIVRAAAVVEDARFRFALAISSSLLFVDIAFTENVGHVT